MVKGNGHLRTCARVRACHRRDETLIRHGVDQCQCWYLGQNHSAKVKVAEKIVVDDRLQAIVSSQVRDDKA